MTQTVRKFSMAGPCITLGKLIRETPRFYCYQPRFSGYFASNEPDMAEKKVGKDKYQMVHVIPCVSCRDHASTQYPNGYED